MKSVLVLLFLFISVLTFAQNVGINSSNPSERLHIQDNSNTKLLLRTSNGTSFFTADSPSNSGFLFRSGGTDRAFMYYSPLSNSLTTSIGLNGWTLSSNGDFRVKERVYSLNDLRLDATENITIEANGALIKIDSDGNIQIQGKNISINADENLSISAANIDIQAQNELHVTSGGGSSFASGGDFNVQSDNLAIDVTKATNINSGTGLALNSSDLFMSTDANATFSIGNGFDITTGEDFDITVNDNFKLIVSKNYNLNVALNYDLNALAIKSEATSTMNLLGSLIRFNNGSTGFAKKGDSVNVGGKIGTITSGSTVVLGN